MTASLNWPEYLDVLVHKTQGHRVDNVVIGPDRPGTSEKAWLRFVSRAEGCCKAVNAVSKSLINECRGI